MPISRSDKAAVIGHGLANLKEMYACIKAAKVKIPEALDRQVVSAYVRLETASREGQYSEVAPLMRAHHDAVVALRIFLNRDR
jgi:hypothetical protein